MNNGEMKFQDPGEGIHEAEVLEVLVSEGDQVQEGQQVLVIETDKAAFEVSAPRAGEVGSVAVSPGDTIHVGDTLLSFRDADAADEDESSEDESSERKAKADTAEAGVAKQRQKSSSVTVDEGLAKAAGSGKPPIPATPATRRLARELGVELTEVRPSGDQGRVLNEDVRAHAEAKRGHRARPARTGESKAKRGRAARDGLPPLPDFSQQGPVERQPLRSVRKKTAERMARAWAEIPHVCHHDLLDITELEQLRKRLAPKVEDAGGKLTLTVLVMKALCANLREFPRFNASLDAERGELILKRYYNIGVAVDTERGLLVPVVRDAASKDLMMLAHELTELADRTRQGKAKREELMAGTFTITNVGPLGGTGFTPIINYPEVAILGLARASLRPVVRDSDAGQRVMNRLMLPVSLAFDHRVIDGAESARFVTRLAERLSDADQFTLSV